MTPFEEALQINMSPGDVLVAESIPVPAHGHLVIEFITALLTVGIGQRAGVNVDVQTRNAIGVRHALVVFPQGTFPAGDIYAASQLVRLYPDQGSEIVFEFYRSDASGSASGNFTVTGFLS